MDNEKVQQEWQFLAPEVVDDALVRLAKINGQVQGVRDSHYGGDGLDDIASAQTALPPDERWVTQAIRSGDPLIYDELMKVPFRHVDAASAARGC